VVLVQFGQLQKKQDQTQQAPAYTGTQGIDQYQAGGNVAGMWGGNNTPQNWARTESAMRNQTTANQQPYQNFINGQLNAGANQTQTWQNPYGNMVNGMLNKQANSGTASQGAGNFLGQYGGQMQSGQGLNWQMPQYQQGQMNPVVNQYMNQQNGRDVYGQVGLGQAGDVANQIAAGGMPTYNMPQGGVGYNDNGQTQGARNSQYQGLQGLLNQPGMSADEIATITKAAIDPAMQGLGQAREQAMSNLSARGLGRSSGTAPIERDYMNSLGNTYQGVLSDLTQQNIGLRNSNRLAGIQGMGQFSQQGMDYGNNQQSLGLQGQSLANQYSLGQGSLASNLASMNQQGGQYAQNMNMNARNQQMNELAGQAGMGADLYNQGENRNLQDVQNQRSSGLQYQGLMQNERGQADQNTTNLLNMGMQGQNQDYGNQNSLLSQLLGYGNQNQNAWQTQNQLNQNQGQYLGNMANSMYGQQYNQGADTRDFYNNQMVNNVNRANQVHDASQGGGIGGFLGGLVGNAASALTGGLTGSLTNSLFGNSNSGNQSSGGQGYSYYNPNYRLNGG
jgi:hypothetical protein